MQTFIVFFPPSCESREIFHFSKIKLKMLKIKLKCVKSRKQAVMKTRTIKEILKNQE